MTSVYRLIQGEKWIMNTEQNKEIVRRLSDEIWNQHNLDIIDELVAEEFVEHNPPLPGFPPGRQAFRMAAAVGLNAFPDCSVSVEDLLAEGDKVVLRWTFRGTHENEIMDIPATGRPVEFGGIYIFRIADGQVQERWAREDIMSLLQQLGAMPAPDSTIA
jgi:steroid delta-isomerase-like uncharacterized protein